MLCTLEAGYRAPRALRYNEDVKLVIVRKSCFGVENVNNSRTSLAIGVCAMIVYETNASSRQILHASRHMADCTILAIVFVQSG